MARLRTQHAKVLLFSSLASARPLIEKMREQLGGIRGTHKRAVLLCVYQNRQPQCQGPAQNCYYLHLQRLSERPAQSLAEEERLSDACQADKRDRLDGRLDYEISIIYRTNK